MIKITHNKKVYYVEKLKIIYVLKKISNKEIKEKDIRKYMRKYHLYDDYFLENVNKIKLN